MEAFKERKEQLEKEEENEKGKKNTQQGTTSFDPMAKAVLRDAIITKSSCGEEDEKNIGVKDAEDVLVFSRSVHKIDSSLD